MQGMDWKIIWKNHAIKLIFFKQKKRMKLSELLLVLVEAAIEFYKFWSFYRGLFYTVFF